MKVLIIGANGKIGKRVAKKMSSSEQFDPTALIRKEEQKTYFDGIDVPVTIESLESPQEQLNEVFAGFDSMVFCAGSGGTTGYDKTIEIDLYGAVKSINAAKDNGINRFVMVSAAFSDVPSYWSDAMKPYYIAKQLADKELTRIGLDYTILRPVKLTDENEAGGIMIASDPHTLKEEIPRAAVAEVILQVLRNDETIGKTMEMSEGSQGIEVAIKQFAKNGY